MSLFHTTSIRFRVNGPYSLAAAALGLRPGVHRLDVRARDATGKTDPRGQGFYFTILAVPLQNRDWFMPLVAGMALLLVYLSLKGILRLRQLARTNEQLQREIQSRIRTQAVLQETRDELELRVEERTAELSRSRQSLTEQVAERQRAESATAKLEAQLRQAQKMEAIGTLAGGIAHDFNNILAVILPSAHLALKEAGSHPTLQKSLTRIVNSAERARKLVKQILALSRLQQPERQTVDLESLVKESMKLLRAALPSTIEIVVDCQPNLPTVLADPTQIHQVIMNLCSNAEHAMRGRVGRLDIQLESIAAAESARSLPELAPGSYGKLSVSDTGCGIDDATLKRIFDPFFTTKSPQEGNGLGLAVVHGIIKDHGGAIHVRSQVGHGTTFDLFIPTQAAPAGSPPEVAVPI